MSESQRAMVAARTAKIKDGGDRRSDQSASLHSEKTLQESAELFNVSRRSVADAKLIQRESLELAKKKAYSQRQRFAGAAVNISCRRIALERFLARVCQRFE